jgi:hypothetical protein
MNPISTPDLGEWQDLASTEARWPLRVMCVRVPAPAGRWPLMSPSNPLEPVQDFGDPLRLLRRGPCDGVGLLPYVEQVAHGVHEDPPRLSPVMGLVEFVWVNREPESGSACPWVPIPLIPKIAHRLKSLRQGQCIEVNRSLGKRGHTRSWGPGCV